MFPSAAPRRGSLDLSASFIVVLILSSVILVMGILLLYDMYQKATSGVKPVEDQAEADRFEAFDKGQRVVNPLNTKSIARKEMVLFHIRVRNKLDAPVIYGTHEKGNFFRIVATPSSVPEGYSLEGAETWLRMTNTAGWVSNAPPNQIDAYILNNEREDFGIGIGVPRDALAGTYAFSLDIQYADPASGGPDSFSSYSSVEKLYVTVCEKDCPT